MAFVKLDKSNRGPVFTLEERVTMAAHLGDGGPHKSKSISFRISYPLRMRLGWEPVDRRIAIGVYEGTGTDRGFFQLIAEPDGYVATINSSKNKTNRQATHGVSLQVTTLRMKHYVLNECPVTAHVVSHVVDGSTLIVEAPDWLRFNPLSVSEDEATHVVSSPVPQPPSVTTVHHIERTSNTKRRHMK